MPESRHGYGYDGVKRYSKVNVGQIRKCFATTCYYTYPYPVFSLRDAMVQRAQHIHLLGNEYTISPFNVSAEPAYYYPCCGGCTNCYSSSRPGIYRCDGFVDDTYQAGTSALGTAPSAYPLIVTSPDASYYLLLANIIFNGPVMYPEYLWFTIGQY